MKSDRFHITWLFTLFCVATAALNTNTLQAAEKAIIRAQGAHTLSNPVQKLGDEFMKTRDDVTVVCSAGGSTIGIRKLLDREVDLALCVRKLNLGEESAAADLGVKPVNRVVGHDGVAIIVNRNNPVSELTLDQVVGLFTGKLNNWNQLGGRPRPVNVYIADPRRHGTPGFFQRRFLKGKDYAESSKIVRDWEPIIKRVGKDRSGFAFCLTQKALDSVDTIKIVPIKEGTESPAIPLSWETVADASYPLRRPLYFYWDANSAPSALQSFVDFCVKRGLNLSLARAR